eukprot:gene22445-biopygen4237
MDQLGGVPRLRGGVSGRVGGNTKKNLGIPVDCNDSPEFPGTISSSSACPLSMIAGGAYHFPDVFGGGMQPGHPPPHAAVGRNTSNTLLEHTTGFPKQTKQATKAPDTVKKTATAAPQQWTAHAPARNAIYSTKSKKLPPTWSWTRSGENFHRSIKKTFWPGAAEIRPDDSWGYVPCAPRPGHGRVCAPRPGHGRVCAPRPGHGRVCAPRPGHGR